MNEFYRPILEVRIYMIIDQSLSLVGYQCISPPCKIPWDWISIYKKAGEANSLQTFFPGPYPNFPSDYLKSSGSSFAFAPAR